MDLMPMPTPDCHLQPPVAPTGSRPVRRASRAEERIGDMERARTCDELSNHYAAGRISPVELDARLAAAMEALTLRDLHVITRDLPRPSAPSLNRPTPTAPSRSAWTAMDLLVVVGLLGSVLLVGGMLLVLGSYHFSLFVAAGVGGTAALAAGAAVVHLAHRRGHQCPR